MASWEAHNNKLQPQESYKYFQKDKIFFLPYTEAKFILQIFSELKLSSKIGSVLGCKHSSNACIP